MSRTVNSPLTITDVQNGAHNIDIKTFIFDYFKIYKLELSKEF